MRFDPARHATQQRAVAQRHHDVVEALRPAQQLDRDRACAFGDRSFATVLNELKAVLLREAFRLRMNKMLRRYPAKQTGLAYWDFELLRKTREQGPKAARIIAYAMTEDFYDGDLTGDWYLFGRLLRLGDSRLPKPLLTLTGDIRHMRHTEAALTPFGQAVLDGREANFPANPIDDWAGGVHLSSITGNVWLNDNGRLIPGH